MSFMASRFSRETLCEFGKYHETNVERGHAVTPDGLKRARNSVGVAEIARENARSMRRRDPNPHRIATLPICTSVSSRARLAWSMRTRSTNSEGLALSSLRNRRLRERSETPASAASVSVRQCSCGSSAIFSANLERRWSRIPCAASSGENCPCPPGRIRKTTWRRATAKAIGRPKICLDQRKRQIDAGRDACRCPDIAVTKVDRFRINIDLRSKSTKTLDIAPMSCCSAPIKQARCCEEECASANGHDTAPAPARRLD